MNLVSPDGGWLDFEQSHHDTSKALIVDPVHPQGDGEDVAQSEEAMGQICATLALLQGQITIDIHYVAAAFARAGQPNRQTSAGWRA